MSKYIFNIYLTLTGLFHKAIAQSGVAINPWASVYGNSKTNAFKLASLLGKETSDPQTAVEYLKTIDTEKLVITHQRIATKLVCTYYNA